MLLPLRVQDLGVGTVEKQSEGVQMEQVQVKCNLSLQTLSAEDYSRY